MKNQDPIEVGQLHNHHGRTAARDASGRANLYIYNIYMFVLGKWIGNGGGIGTGLLKWTRPTGQQ